MSPTTPYPKLKRTDHGKVVEDTHVVAADIIALVAGVSGGSVAKTLIAIQAVSEATGIDVRDLISADAVPFFGPDERRAKETSKWAAYIASKPDLMMRYEDDLDFLKRYARRIANKGDPL